MEIISVKLTESRQGYLTVSLKGFKHLPFCNHAIPGWFIIHETEFSQRFIITFPGFQGQNPLADGGKHLLGRKFLIDSVFQFQPDQSGSG